MVRTVSAFESNEACYAVLKLLKNMALLFLMAAALFTGFKAPQTQ